jgi:hypothetical protein
MATAPAIASVSASAAAALPRCCRTATRGRGEPPACVAARVFGANTPETRNARETGHGACLPCASARGPGPRSRYRCGRRAGAEAETSASRQRRPSALPARCSRLTRRADTRSPSRPRDSRNNPCSRQADQVVALRTARRALAEDDRRRRIRPAPAPMSSPSTSWPPSAAVVLAVGVSARIDSMTGRGHVRCRSENGTRASCWRAVATASLLGCLVTDAGAGRAPIARRRTLAASSAGAAGWAVRTLASPCEARVWLSRSAALTGPLSERARRPLDGLTLESGCVLGSTPRPCAGR